MLVLLSSKCWYSNGLIYRYCQLVSKWITRIGFIVVIVFCWGIRTWPWPMQFSYRPQHSLWCESDRTRSGPKWAAYCCGRRHLARPQHPRTRAALPCPRHGHATDNDPAVNTQRAIDSQTKVGSDQSQCGGELVNKNKEEPLKEIKNRKWKIKGQEMAFVLSILLSWDEHVTFCVKLRLGKS